MKSLLTLLCAGILCLGSASLKAQPVEIMGGNMLNGGITGGILGAATMGLHDTDDLTYLKTGVGAGIFAGVAIGIYDIATLPRGQQFFISGTFNDGRNSSIIILLDTVYGATGGAFIGTASMLIADRPLLQGLQYGASYGTWIGFTFGLLDSFILAERNRDFIGAKLLNRQSLFETQFNNSTLGLGQTRIAGIPSMQNGDIETHFHPVFEVISFRMKL